MYKNFYISQEYLSVFIIVIAITYILSFYLSSKIKNTKGIQNLIIGFLGGIFIAFVSFDLIPVALEHNRPFVSCIILCFLIFLLLFIHRLQLHSKANNIVKNKYLYPIIYSLHNIHLFFGVSAIILIEKHIEPFMIGILIHLFIENVCIFLKEPISNHIRYTYLTYFIMTVSVLQSLFIYLGIFIIHINQEISYVFIYILCADLLIKSFGQHIPKSNENRRGNATILFICIGYLASFYIKFTF
ncbi:MAG: hypothetical protein ACK5LV_05470 [Lachnospirales bacterium]